MDTINERELDKLTESVLNNIIAHLGKLAEDDTLSQKYAVGILCQDELKSLFRKGYRMGKGEAILNGNKANG
ncbi:hypothetical protein C8N40_111110 [Pontibacter mucosus]|uniref:Uncharacterized protein n=1 Tax=Pontibacter mucosus TaxID=1649266 RepID=A0A2T5YD65_9BACT|nr:hypothetical protein [Pontibacter mucosus]PTX14445.1 hypothetical protein C8N40_111110 [Pontibacter mucosus]